MKNNLLFCTINKLLILLLIGFSTLCQGKKATPGASNNGGDNSCILVFDIPTQTSCETSADISIRAVHNDGNSCKSSFSKIDKTLKFWTKYINPDKGTKQAALTTADNNERHFLTTSEKTSVSLYFDSEGKAVFHLTYDDAGQLTLYASYNDTGKGSKGSKRPDKGSKGSDKGSKGSDKGSGKVPDKGANKGPDKGSDKGSKRHDKGSGNKNGSEMTGKATFVIKPAKLLVEVNDPKPACSSGDATCSIFKAAGEVFNLSVSATCDDETKITPNFQINGIDLSVSTIAPDPGNSADLGVKSINIIDDDDGTLILDNQTISEVGVFTITATPPSYLGETISAATSTNIGRFTPHHFQLSTPSGGDGVLNGGNPFVYTGQMASLTPPKGQISYATQPTFTITAKSKTKDTEGDYITTQNYTGEFIKIKAQDIHEKYISNSNAANSLSLTGKLAKGILTDGKGVLTYLFDSTDNFVYKRDANARIPPFLAKIDLQITDLKDSDQVKALKYDGEEFVPDNLTLHPDANGMKVYFGRWVMENSYGLETLALRIPMQLQYWDGGQFVTNNIDSFTTFNSENITLSKADEVDLTKATSASGYGIFNNGQTEQLMLAAPDNGERGSVTVGYSVPTWLQFDWDNDGLYDNNPSAQATFGLYRGNDRIIYRQEVFQ